MERLHVYLARAGVASRRKAEGLISSGRVAVNGRRITVLGTKIDPQRDQVTVNGERVQPQMLVYYALNKPAGVVSARISGRPDPLVTDLVPAQPPVVPVGRLDKRSTGLMILTNDGSFAYQVTHPKFVHEKEYELTVRAVNPQSLGPALDRLQRGVRVLGERLTFDQITLIRTEETRAELRVVIHTGKKRQIRRMAAAVGLAVDHLHRVRIGKLGIGSLEAGKWRVMTPAEVIEQ